MQRLRRLLAFDIVPGQRRRRPVRWALIAIVGSILAIGWAILRPNSFAASPTEVRARFRAPEHIYPNTLVRVRGVDVGQVSEAQLKPDGTVAMKLDITDQSLVVHGDAHASLFYRTLFGRNVYVELDPGSPRVPALGDAEIPVTRTTAQVEVDEALRPLTPAARNGSQKMLDTLDEGLTGDAPRRSIKRSGPALEHTGKAIGAVRGSQPGRDLPDLVQGGRRALTALNADEEALAGLVDNADVALGVTAARRADLGSIVDQAPATLAETRRTMVRLRRTLDIADPVVTNLRPGVRRIAPAARAATPTLRKVDALVPVAIPALRDLQPALVSLRTVSRTGVPLMDRLEPTLERTDRKIIPFLDQRSATTKLKNFQAIGPTFATVSSSASTFDEGGFEQRFQPGGRGFASGLPSRFPAAAGSCPSESEQACKQLFDAISTAFGGGEGGSNGVANPGAPGVSRP